MNESERLGLTEVKRLLNDRGLHPSRAFGQNFVIDPNTVDRIARLSRVGKGDYVVEIGAGLGALTLALIGTDAQVLAVEIDQRLTLLLEETIGERAKIVAGDALRLEWTTLLHSFSGDHEVVLVANLPYNIATPLVMTLLENVPAMTRMLIMVQREVGERFVATTGAPGFGAVSVRIAYFARAQMVGRVSANVFYPRPKVESTLVEIIRHREPAVPSQVASYGEISVLIRAGFATRRKMLRRSLKGLVDPEAFEAAHVSPTARAEELSIEIWGKLAACRRIISSSPTPS